MRSATVTAVLVLALVWLVGFAEAVPMGTVFTYQGRLMDLDQPADGLYDFLFKLYNEPNGVGYNIPSNNLNDVDVIDGYFTAELNFGSNVFNGNAKWLEVSVRAGDSNDIGDYVTLNPRQEITPIPYALHTRGIFVDSEKNVGIGTTTPKSRLHIEQDAGAWDEGIRLSYGDHEWDIITDYGGERLHIIRDQNSTEGLVIKNGNIGIGTTSPSVKLDVVGTDANALISAINNGLTDASVGVYGEHYNGNYGKLGGFWYGVYGYGGVGLDGVSESGNGVRGHSESGNGVRGNSQSGYGVFGQSATSYGVYGNSFASYAGYFNGDVFVLSNCSAESFTDRTPYPKDLATAYEAVMSMERLPDGQYDDDNKEAQLDHTMLSDFIRSEDSNRDLSATVSCHNEVLKDLIRKQKELSKAYTYIEQLQKQNELLELRLVKFETMITKKLLK